MKIRELSVRNCLSFGELGLLGKQDEGSLELKDFNLFIGPNNGGKSNVLKLLDFVRWLFDGISRDGNPRLADMNLGPSTVLGDSHDWFFRQRTDRRIDFLFGIEIEEKDTALSRFLDAYDSGKDYRDPVRFLLNQKKRYPKRIRVAGFVDEVSGPPRATIQKVEIPNDNPNYSRYPLLDREGRATLALRPQGKRCVWKAETWADENWQAALQGVGQPIQQLLSRIHNLPFALAVSRVPPIRDIKPVGDEVTESLHRLQNGSSLETKLYARILEMVKRLGFSGEDAQLLFPSKDGGLHRLNVQANDLQLPLDQYGSGVGQLLSMITEVVRCGTNKIVLVEEPEAHLHPRLQREFIGFLKETDASLQHQYLITTHSSVFLDDFIRAKDGVFHVDCGRDSGATQAYSSVTTLTLDNLPDLFRSMGVKPSDLLFANGILVVEGKTDKLVYCRWAELIGKSFESRGIEVTDAEGAGNIHNYLVSDLVKRTCLARMALCDKNAEKELRRQLAGTVNRADFKVLSMGDLEDYYPRRVVLEFVTELCARKGKTNDVPDVIPVGRTVKTLTQLLGGDGWKVQLAQRVAEGTKPEEIHDEVRALIEGVWKRAG